MELGSAPLAPLVQHCREAPQESIALKEIRGLILHLGGDHHRRFVLHYDRWPYRWIGFARQAPAQQEATLRTLAKTPLCCWDKTFTYRAATRFVHTRLEGQCLHQGAGVVAD